ncbi:MAG TPA: class I SAM-dependent methyltransferase [Acidimicrobiales bacterium]|jgi:ubiquinone/menaquinone biosynthesis C-methylase UbiE
MSEEPGAELLGTRAFWDARGRENAAWYVDTSLDYEHPDMEAFWATGDVVVREALLEAPVRPSGSQRALEIGSGLGRICRALRTHFNEVVGIDIAPSMVEQARALVQTDGVRFDLGDGSGLPGVADGSVDFVVTFTVFQHQTSTDAIAASLNEVARVLAPGGVVAAQWNNIDAGAYERSKRQWRRQAQLRRLPLVGRRFGPSAPQDEQRLAPQFLGTTATVAFMRETLEACGLQVVGTKGEGTLFAWVWARQPDAVTPGDA